MHRAKQPLDFPVDFPGEWHYALAGEGTEPDKYGTGLLAKLRFRMAGLDA